MIRQALAAKLVSAVGSQVGNRIRPVALAQNDSFPAIVYRRASAGHEATLDDEDNLPAPRFEVTSWARDYLDAVNLAENVRGALENEGRATWPFTGGSVVVQAVTFLDEEDVFDDESQGADKPLFGVAQVYELICED